LPIPGAARPQEWSRIEIHLIGSDFDAALPFDLLDPAGPATPDLVVGARDVVASPGIRPGLRSPAQGSSSAASKNFRRSSQRRTRSVGVLVGVQAHPDGPATVRRNPD